jgi:hypothetical protein
MTQMLQRLVLLATCSVLAASCGNSEPFFRVKQIGNAFVVSGSAYSISVGFPMRPKLLQSEIRSFEIDTAEVTQGDDYLGVACFSVSSETLAAADRNATALVDLMRSQLRSQGTTIVNDRPLDLASGHLYEGQRAMPEFQGNIAYIVIKVYQAKSIKKVCQVTAATVGPNLSAIAQSFLDSTAIRQ